MKTNAGNGYKIKSTKSTSSILDRPFPTVSGRRCVPHVVNAGGITFLRYKKPQPQIITCMINRRLEVRDKRWDRTYELRELVSLGELEDSWDRLLEDGCGLKWSIDRRTSWATETSKASDEIRATVRRQAQREEQMSRKLMSIQEKEKTLAEQEKAARLDEKRQGRAIRRSLRMEHTDSIQIHRVPEAASTSPEAVSSFRDS